MALTFGAVSSDRVNCGSAATLDDLTAFTFMGWVYPTTLTTLRYFFLKGSLSAGKQLRLSGTGGNVQLLVDRATTDTSYITNDTPFVTLNKWYFLAATYDDAASPSGHIYVGDLVTIAAERTYGTSNVGAGATSADAANDFLIGNGGTTTALQGRIANAIYISGALSLGEIRSWQFRPRVLANTRGFWHLGYNGTSTQADHSGNGSNGTVTGATVSDHVPLRAPFGFDAGAIAWVVAGGGGNVTINGALGTLTLAGLAATVVPTGTASIAAGLGALTLTGLSATVTTSGTATIAANLGTLVLAGQSAAVTASGTASVAAALGALTLTGLQATIDQQDNLVINAALGTLTLAGLSATVAPSGTANVVAAVGALTLTGLQATVSISGDAVVQVSIGVLILAGLQASVSFAAEEEVITPAERTFAVAFEDRVLVIETEERVYTA